MSSIFCITPSKVRQTAVLACVLTGCASTVPVDKPVAALEPSRPATETASTSTMLSIEYGNRSTRATFQVDLSSADVQVELSGRTLRTDTVRSAMPQVAPRVVTESVVRSEDAMLPRARLLADSAVRGESATTDSTTAKVVAAIRKAQEFFYQARYAEASDMARKAIAIRPTAEAHALAGSISWVRKEREEARLHWLRARELDPAFPGLSAVLDSLVSVESRR